MLQQKVVHNSSVGIAVWRKQISVTIALVWFSIVYLPVTLLLASRKQLWNDELFTFYIAQLRDLQRIWDVLPTAGDQNPPLFYWLTGVAEQVWPGSLLSVRLPEIAGFWLTGICLIVFVSRHLPPVFGLAAAMLALVSGAYPYAFEARPYAMMLGFCALALVCWQQARIGRSGMWFAAMAVSLALAVSVHYYSILAFVPLAAAEAVYLYDERRIRWAVWAGLAVGALPLVIYLPLIRSAATFSQAFWARPRGDSLPDFYSFLLSPVLIPVLASLFAAGTLQFLRRGFHDRNPVDVRTGPSVPEVAAIAVFSLLPAITLATALFVTHAYTHRYAVPAIIGCSVGASWLISKLFRAAPVYALITVSVLSLIFVVKQVRTVRGIASVANHQSLTQDLIRTAGAYPIIVADPHLYFELAHQTPALRPRMVYVAEPDLALKHTGTDAVDRSLLGIGHVAPVQFRTLASVAAGGPALVYGYPAPNGWAWIVQELAAARVPMSVAGVLHGRLLLLVNGPAEYQMSERRPSAN